MVEKYYSENLSYLAKITEMNGFFLMKQRKELYLFLGRTALYFLIFLGLFYFFSYLGQGQGSFIYNEF